MKEDKNIIPSHQMELCEKYIKESMIQIQHLEKVLKNTKDQLVNIFKKLEYNNVRTLSLSDQENIEFLKSQREEFIKASELESIFQHKLKLKMLDFSN